MRASTYCFRITRRAVPPAVQSRRASHGALRQSPGTGAGISPVFFRLIDSDLYFILLGALLALDLVALVAVFRA